jgi:hypothetical protein
MVRSEEVKYQSKINADCPHNGLSGPLKRNGYFEPPPHRLSRSEAVR